MLARAAFCKEIDDKAVALRARCYDRTACTIVIGSAEARDLFVSQWTNPRSDVVGFSQP